MYINEDYITLRLVSLGSKLVSFINRRIHHVLSLQIVDFSLKDREKERNAFHAIDNFASIATNKVRRITLVGY